MLGGSSILNTSRVTIESISTESMFFLSKNKKLPPQQDVATMAGMTVFREGGERRRPGMISERIGGGRGDARFILQSLDEASEIRQVGRKSS